RRLSFAGDGRAWHPRASLQMLSRVRRLATGGIPLFRQELSIHQRSASPTWGRPGWPPHVALAARIALMRAIRSSNYVVDVHLDRESIPSFDEFPFSVPSIRELYALEFPKPVTFLVGEN